MKSVSKWMSVRLLLAVCLMAIVLPSSFSAAIQAFAQTSNPIVLENQNAGSSSWILGQPGFTLADDATGQIAGYPAATSVNKGEQIAFHVSVNAPQTFRIDFYRMGWYGGLGGRLMQTVGPLSGVVQPTCPLDANTGLVECNWSKSYTLTVPSNWTTGVYAVMLTNQNNVQYQFTFVVRDDSRVADFLYQQPVLTYAAYNNWPAGTSKGKSLYNYNSSGANTLAGTPRAVKVSLNRPGGDQYSGGFDSSDTSWENYLVSFLEHEGYDVSYSTNIDTHVNGARLLNYKAFFSTGHDEYWTKEMFDNAEAARNARVNLAFWGANNVYWQVRLEPDSNGNPNRTVVGYKEASLQDPVTSTVLKTTLFRNVGRPEQTLIGVQYTTDNAALGILPFTVQNSTSPFYAGSGLTNGTQVPNMIGYEVDKLFSEFTQPISQSYTLLGTSPFTSSAGVGTVSQAVMWQHAGGAWVFGSGTMSWSWALARGGNENTGIQQLTRNILSQLLQTSPPPPTATPGPTPTATPIPPGLCPFPAVGVSDNFNRANGTSLLGAWFGGVSNYGVANNQLSVTGAGDSIMAWNVLLGRDQEASVKIANYNASSGAIRLALKVQEGSFGNPHILVGYLPNQNRIQVLTYDPAVGFLERGSYPVTLQPGDVLGARALSTGFVEAFINGNKVLSIDIGNWVNNAVGGFSGLWATNAAGTVLDDYAVGNIACTSLFTPTPAPTATSAPTATPSPSTCLFPAVGVSDNFNRADGTALSGAWFGGVSNFAVAGNQLSVNGTSDSLMAWNVLLGSDQEASVKIVSYSASSSAIRLFLKVQDGNLGNAHILVGYLPSQNRIQVLTYDPAVGFLERGSYPVTLQPGDVLGARALSTGLVEAYINSNKVLSADITGWINNAGGGFSGVWATNAAGTQLDDYAAGNVACTILVTPTPAPSTPTATPPVVPPGACPFPALGVSDNFNRADGTALVGNWFGGVSNFAVAGNQLSINGTGDSIMAWNILPGSDQEVSAKIVSYNASSSAIRLALKVQDGSFGNPHILVGYLPSQNRIQVLTYDPAIGYLERGSYAITLQPGDVLGARALGAGTVSVYVNSTMVLNVGIAGWVNNATGGFTGLWASNAAGTRLDDYAAGNVACSIAATPTSAPGAATVTPTPTQTPVVINNLALGKPATQASTDFSGVAGRAVDGNTNGVYSANSVSHTGNQANPWWQVDLGAGYAINTIVLWNRTDCCADRLTNFYVFVSNTDLAGRSFSSIVNDASVWRYQRTTQSPTSLNIPAGVNGRYVRVQLAGSNYLSLAEVQVFGNAPVPTSTPTPQPVPQVTSFTLINADTDQPVPGYDPIPNNATINLTTLNVPRINVRANVAGPVASVRFGLNSNTNYRTESTAPYALESDDGAGNYVGVSPAAGTYDVRGTAYTGSNATGTAGATTTVRYVISYAAITATPGPTNTPAPPTATPTRTPVPPTATPTPTSVACSSATGSAVVVTFVNNSNFPVNVFWKNASCQEVLFQSALQPGSSYGANTFSGHVWVIRNTSTGAFVKAYTATSSNATVNVLGGVAPTATPTAAPSTRTFSNASNISIPGTSLFNSGPASTYPSNIAVSGMSGTVSKVTVSLKSLSHGSVGDIDMLLVSPTGQKLLLMSDVGGGRSVQNVTLNFDGASTVSLPQNASIGSSTYRPTNYGTGDSFPSPAPGTPYAAVLSTFNGINPNGTWRLYINDDSTFNNGQMSQGWSLTVTTGGTATLEEEPLFEAQANTNPVASGTPAPADESGAELPTRGEAAQTAVQANVYLPLIQK